MSKQLDLNDVLTAFEHEIDQLHVLNGFYQELNSVIASQLELSTKVDDNIRLVKTLIEKQEALDLSQYIGSLDDIKTDIFTLKQELMANHQRWQEQFLEQQKTLKEDSPSFFQKISSEHKLIKVLLMITLFSSLVANVMHFIS